MRQGGHDAAHASRRDGGHGASWSRRVVDSLTPGATGWRKDSEGNDRPPPPSLPPRPLALRGGGTRDAGHSQRGAPRRPARRARLRLHGIGNVNLKVAPRPTALSTQIRPPCSSTNFLASVRPSPVPSRFRSSLPTCRNSSKIAA